MEAPRTTPDATPEIIAVMCEPVRWRSYGLLHGLGPLRAAQLAQKVSVSEASMIKHLELMEQVGFVRSERDDSKASRYWQWCAVTGGLRLTDLVDSADDASQEAMRRWMQVFVQSQNLVLRQWAKDEHEWALPWRMASLNYDYWMHLTVEELGQLEAELQAVTNRWDELSRRRGRVEGDSAIYVSTNAFPVRE